MHQPVDSYRRSKEAYYLAKQDNVFSTNEIQTAFHFCKHVLMINPLYGIL